MLLLVWFFKSENMASSFLKSCINAPNKFHYVCSSFIMKLQSRSLTKTLKKTYSLYISVAKEIRIKVEFLTYIVHVNYYVE